MRKIARLLFLYSILITSHSFGQESLWLENEINEKTEHHFTFNHNQGFHSTVKAYVIEDSIKTNLYGEGIWDIGLIKEWNKSSINLFPLVNISGGFSSNDSSSALGQVGLGLALKSHFGSKLYFSLSAYFEDSTYPNYVSNFTESHGVVPGMGRAYPGELGYNFTRIDALLSYRPFDFLRIEGGLGKHFIGDGYRSFFVSDIASNNPFGRLNLNIWHLNFSATYSSLTHLAPNTGPDWQQAGKYTARHYLSWNATPWLHVGFFESIVWQASDSTYYRGFDAHYANPIQFYRPVEYSIGSADNSLLGFDLSVKIKKRWTIYTQFLLDEFLLREMTSGDGWWANKYAIQLGLKVFEPFSLAKTFLRFEFNLARPFTFSHGSPKQNYAHLGEAIAHPLGANFYEGIVEFNFQIGKRGRIENRIIAYLKGEDPDGENMGGDIFKAYTNPTNVYGNYIGQGDQRKVFLYQLQYSYLLSSENRLKLIGGLQLRNENYKGASAFSTQVFVGLSTTIWNRYYSF